MEQCTETVLPEISAHILIGYMRASTDGDRQALDLQPRDRRPVRDRGRA